MSLSKTELISIIKQSKLILELSRAILHKDRCTLLDVLSEIESDTTDQLIDIAEIGLTATIIELFESIDCLNVPE